MAVTQQKKESHPELAIKNTYLRDYSGQSHGSVAFVVQPVIVDAIFTGNIMRMLGVRSVVICGARLWWRKGSWITK